MKNIVGVAASGTGAQLFSSDGAVYALGGAAFTGSLPGLGITTNSIVGGSAV